MEKTVTKFGDIEIENKSFTNIKDLFLYVFFDKR